LNKFADIHISVKLFMSMLHGGERGVEMAFYFYRPQSTRKCSKSVSVLANTILQWKC